MAESDTKTAVTKSARFSLAIIFLLGLCGGLLGSRIYSGMNQAELKAEIRSLERKNRRLMKENKSLQSELAEADSNTQN